MKYFKKKLNFSWSTQKVIFTFLLYLTIIIIGIIGVFYSSRIDTSMKYLFITPSYLSNSDLNWTTTVWVGILGIHGTIAALSITFMGMFVSQVSQYSKPGFEDICKSLLLRKSHFLKFSLNSIFSLLSGIILLSFGGGLIAYIISVIISLGFIFSYGLMYLRLYTVTENPTIIDDYLFLELKSIGEIYHSFNICQQKVIRQFNKCCDKLSHIDRSWNYNFTSKEQRSLEVFTDKEQAILSNFCPTCLKNINNEIKKNIEYRNIKLLLTLNFNKNVSHSSFYIEFEKNQKIKDEFIDKIERMIERALLINDLTPNEIITYHNYEKAVINNIRSNLLKGDEWGLNFGIEALLALTDKNDITYTMSRLDHLFTYNNKKNSIDYSIFAAFFEKFSSEMMIKNDFKKANEIMGGLINLGRYIYTNDYFHEFYSLISRTLHNYARYNFSDNEHSIFNLYVYTVRQNLLNQNYKSFGLNTKFLTEEFRYLQHSDDGESLSTIENQMVQCVKDIVTLILIRLEYLCGKENKDDNEFSSLCNYLKSWVNAAFFEDIYYKEGTYDILFVIPREPDIDARRTLREIPDYQSSIVSIGNDTYKAITLIMTQSSFNKNSLNPIFIRDKRDFLEKTKITTSQLQAIISYLRGDNFNRILEIIEKSNSDKTNKEDISRYLESIIIEKNDIISNFVASSELDDTLVQKYKNDVSISLNRYLGKIINTEHLPTIDYTSRDASCSLINKREVMKSIDGVHYSMNGGYHAEVGIYYWIKKLLDKVKSKKKNIIKIETLNELPTDKLVTIQYMVKGESDVYRYSRGLRMTDEKGILCLGNSGLYYMDFENEFKCSKGKTLFNILIEKISPENIDLINREKVTIGENPLSYAYLEVAINLELIKKEDYTFYFLSTDNCKKLTKLRNHSTCLSIDNSTFLNDPKKNIIT
ncbi:TPA: hypothetical protein OUB84_000996 [Morganella morganii]|nr:hypothetical protein [Morganella morganii]